MAPLLILLAAVTPATADTPPHTDLGGGARRGACAQGDSKDVVVCGRKEEQEQYRLHPLANSDRYEPKPLRAQVGLGGSTTLGIAVQTKELTPGQRSSRAMVTLSTAF
jgi:hypothetical protein